MAPARSESRGARAATAARDRRARSAVVADALTARLAGEPDPAYRRRVRAVIEWLAPQPGERVLDLGCGRAFLLGHLHALGAGPLVGVDLDPVVLREARRAHEPCSVLRADARTLPFRDASFDKVACSEVLEHIADDRAVLREIRRVLRPGGLVALTVPNANYPFAWDPVNKLLERVAGVHVRRGPFAGIWAGHLRLYAMQTLRERVVEAGLDVLEERATTRYGLPFHHLLVYGIGKPLFEKRLLPRGLARRLDRHADPERRAGGGPLGAALRLVDRVDARNQPSEPAGTPTVNLCLLARRP